MNLPKKAISIMLQCRSILLERMMDVYELGDVEVKERMFYINIISRELYKLDQLLLAALEQEPPEDDEESFTEGIQYSTPNTMD